MHHFRYEIKLLFYYFQSSVSNFQVPPASPGQLKIFQALERDKKEALLRGGTIISFSGANQKC